MKAPNILDLKTWNILIKNAMTSSNSSVLNDKSITGSGMRIFYGQFTATAWLVILIGFLLRLWVCLHTVIVNPDGLLYIHQAMSLYYRDWSSLKTCGLTFISSYPLMIAGGYAVLHNWILSARLISLFFGTALLIPLYRILKNLTRDNFAVLSLLVVAVTPVMVSNSVELVRDPIGWFFMSAGVWAVIHPAATDTSRKWLLLTASICFLVAAWARIEAVLYIGVTLLYLAFGASDRKLSHVFAFLSPIAIILLLSAGGLMISRVSFSDLYRGHDLIPNLIGPVIQYRELTTALKNLQWSSSWQTMKFFLPEARNAIWLIAFGVVLNRFLEAFFYPYVLLYIAGVSGILQRCRSDARLIYLLLLVGAGLTLMYMHTLQTWMLYYRFLGIVIIPGAVFCAFGIEKLSGILSRHVTMRSSTAFWIVFLVILGISLPKNIKAPDPDKVVFRQIGHAIYQNHRGISNTGHIPVATSCHTQRIISFYANLQVPGLIPCPLDTSNCWESFPDDPEQFYTLLRQRHIRYVLWEQRSWPSHRFSFTEPSLSGKYTRIGEWFQADTGKMILYGVVPSN